MNINTETVISSLKLMGMGMAAIFIVILIIYASMNVMLKATAKK